MGGYDGGGPVHGSLGSRAQIGAADVYRSRDEPPRIVVRACSHVCPDTRSAPDACTDARSYPGADTCPNAHTHPAANARAHSRADP